MVACLAASMICSWRSPWARMMATSRGASAKPAAPPAYTPDWYGAALSCSGRAIWAPHETPTASMWPHAIRPSKMTLPALYL